MVDGAEELRGRSSANGLKGFDRFNGCNMDSKDTAQSTQKSKVGHV
jgi:hypothetical protein